MVFIGDDWAEAHHDIEIQDEQGQVLARRRLPEGVAGMTRLHELIADHAPPDSDPAAVVVGIERACQVVCVSDLDLVGVRGRC